jgi:uncharacterized membrane protein (DUF4010 family)
VIVTESVLLGFAAALGGGLLIGIERERRKGTGPHSGLAGVRTFTLAALAGAGAQALAQPMLIAAGAALIAALASISYWRNRSRDPGVTTELALLVTYLLGVMAIDHPALAAGGSVVVALLLASRTTLHKFSVDVLTATELRDGLVFAAAALILLPLLPNQPLAWTLDINPRRLWGLVVLVMALQAAGYVAARAAGPRLGLALSGLATGFVSSTGTIAALGARARERPALRTSCVAGALFSTVATVILLGVVVLAVYPPALFSLLPSLLCALVAAAAAAAVPLLRQRGTEPPAPPSGHVFNLLFAMGFAAILAGVTAVVAMINTRWGGGAAATATALAGAFDVHAAATSTLSLAADGRLAVKDVELPVLVAYSTNASMKGIAAFIGGGRAYGARVALGVAVTVAAAWLPFLLSH